MSRSIQLALAFAVALSLGLTVGAGCFSPPTDDVLFACEFDGDDSCPPDYECREDDCCHRIGTPADADLGACALGGNTGGTGTETGAEGTETGAEGTETGGEGTETGA